MAFQESEVSSTIHSCQSIVRRVVSVGGFGSLALVTLNRIVVQQCYESAHELASITSNPAIDTFEVVMFEICPSSLRLHLVVL